MKRKVSEAEKAYRLEQTRAFLLECVMYSTRSLKWGIDNWGRPVERREVYIAESCEGCGGPHPYRWCGAPSPFEPLPSEVA